MIDVSKWPKIDHHEVREIFCDSFGFMTFDGNTLRLDLCVARHDDPKPPHPPTGERHIVVRLAMTPPLAEDLLKKLANLAAQLSEHAKKPATMQ